MEKLTVKEQELFSYIKNEISKNGFAPSIRDMQKDTLISSTSIVHALLVSIKNKGYIDFDEGKRRTIRILKSGEEKIKVYGDEEYVDEKEIFGLSDKEGIEIAEISEDNDELKIKKDDFVLVDTKAELGRGDVAAVKFEDGIFVGIIKKNEKQTIVFTQKNEISIDKCTVLGKVIFQFRKYEKK